MSEFTFIRFVESVCIFRIARIFVGVSINYVYTTRAKQLSAGLLNEEARQHDMCIAVSCLHNVYRSALKVYSKAGKDQTEQLKFNSNIKINVIRVSVHLFSV